MSSYVVSARKYRPVTFRSVIGQPAVTGTLKNAIRTGHVAQAYLFCGPRGVGKTTCARILSRTLNCLSPTEDVEACGECESCLAFAQQRSYNIHELDAASNNSVEDIRQLIEKVRIPPQIGKYSIYIIDEVHMLSTQAFNAFLKTLEEPPAHAVFILATTEKHKILPTILSRCQVFDFHRIRIDDMVEYLMWLSEQESVSAEKQALHVIAEKADGGMRDALSVFDQMVSFTDAELTYKAVIEHLNVLDYEYFFRLTEAFLIGDTSNTLLIYNDILEKGFNGHFFIDGLASHFRDLLVSKDEITLSLLETGDEIRNKYKEQSRKCSPLFLLEALRICSQAEAGFKTSRNQRLHVELALLNLCSLCTEKKNDNREQSSLKPEVQKPVSPDLPAAKPMSKPVVSVPVLTPSPSIPVSPTSSAPVSSTPSIKDALKSASANKSVNPVVATTDTENGKTSGGIDSALNQDNTDSVSVKADSQGDADKMKSVTPELLLEKWADVAGVFEADNPRLYSALTDRKPCLKENGILVIESSNAFLKEAIEKAGGNISDAIKTHIGKGVSRIEVVVTEDSPGGENRCYTDEEKFAYMASKNPDLIKLKDKFKLDYF